MFKCLVRPLLILGSLRNRVGVFGIRCLADRKWFFIGTLPIYFYATQIDKALHTGPGCLYCEISCSFDIYFAKIGKVAGFTAIHYMNFRSQVNHRINVIQFVSPNCFPIDKLTDCGIAISFFETRLQRSKHWNNL